MIVEVLNDKGQVPGIARWRDRRVAALWIDMDIDIGIGIDIDIDRLYR